MHDLLLLKVCAAWHNRRKHREEYNVTITNKFWILPQINISLFSLCCFQILGTVVSDSEFKICEASQMCDHLWISESLKFEFFLELNRLSSKNNSITQTNFYTGSTAVISSCAYSAKKQFCHAPVLRIWMNSPPPTSKLPHDPSVGLWKPSISGSIFLSNIWSWWITVQSRYPELELIRN